MLFHQWYGWQPILDMAFMKHPLCTTHNVKCCLFLRFVISYCRPSVKERYGSWCGCETSTNCALSDAKSGKGGFISQSFPLPNCDEINTKSLQLDMVHKKMKLIKLTWTPFPPTKNNNNDSLLEKTSSYGWWFRNPKANHPTSMKPVVNNGINGFQPQLVFSPDFWIINRIINRQLAGLRRSILWGFARRLRHHASVSRRRLTHEPCILPIYENHKNPTKKMVFSPYMDPKGTRQLKIFLTLKKAVFL